MSHHLGPDARLRVHQDHVSKEGSYTSVRVTGVAEMLTEFFPGHIPEDKDPGLVQAEYHFSVCVQCGLISSVGCDHGKSVWTHREGCEKYTDEMKLPHGLVRPYSQAFPQTPNENFTDGECIGCLLLCPICKADGT